MSCIHGGLGQSQAGAFRPRAAPPATLGPEENLASGRPSAAIPGQGAALRLRPVRSRGPGAVGAAASPGAGVAHGGQDAPPPLARTRRCPFKTSLLPGRETRRRPRRGGQRHPGYRAGDDDGPLGSSQPLRDARLGGAAGACGGLRRHVSTPAPERPAAARPHLAVAWPRTPGPGTRVTDASLSGPRRARAHVGSAPPPARARGAGRPGGHQSASAGPGPPLKSSRGAAREAELRGGRGAGRRAGEAGVRSGWEAGRGGHRLRLRSSAEVKGRERRGGARAARENRRGRTGGREEGGGARSRW